MNDMTPAPISVERFGPIDRDEAYDRDYIPLPGGWEIQTKGKGSTYRICDPNNDDLAIPASPYLHDTLTQMARDVHASHTALLHQLEEMEAEVERLREIASQINTDWIPANKKLAERAEAAERAREEACGLLREVLVWRRTVPPIAETPRKDGGIFGRIAAFLAASGGDRG